MPPPSPPFRAEHIGSLLRPKALIEARKAATSQPDSSEAQSTLLKVQNEAIASVVQSQLTQDIRPITSGEFERFIFYSDFFDRLSGLETQSLPITDPDNFHQYFPVVQTLIGQGATHRNAIVCTGPIKHTHSPLLKEWEYLRSLLSEDQWKECKLTIPSPIYYHIQLHPSICYANTYGENGEARYFQDLATAYRTELLTLYGSGVRNIQIDDPNLSCFCDESYLTNLKSDPSRLLATYIDVHNAILTDLPPNLHVGIHICRGNAPNGTHYSTGGYEVIASQILTGLHYKTFYLEFDTQRAGNFEPLRFLPRGKNVVLGLVSTKFPDLEDVEVLEKRVREAVGVIARAQGRTEEEVLESGCVSVSPQCGFSSGMVGGGKGVDEDVQWRKLGLVREVVRRVWGE